MTDSRVLNKAEFVPAEDTSHLFDDETVSILVVGDAGTHKTYLMGGAPDLFVFDFDANLAVLRPKIVDGSIKVGRFKEVQQKLEKIANEAKGIYKFGQAYPAFLKQLNVIGEMIDKGNCPFRSLGIDSFTTFGNVVMNHVIANTSPSSNPNAVSRANPQGVIDPGTWGQQMRLMETVLDQLTGWPINLIVTAHVHRDANTATTGQVELLPLVTGKLAGKIGIYFNEVWYTEVQGSGNARKWLVKTESTSLMKQAKTTHGVPDGTPAEWDKVSKYFPEFAQ